MRFSPKARGYQALAAIVALFLISGTTLAATSSFDSIKVGRSDNSSLIQLQGQISNPGKTAAGKARPVLIADDLQVDKNATVRGKLILGKATWIEAPGDGNIVGINDSLLVTGETDLSSLNVTGAAAFAGTATVSGTLDIRGALVAGSYNVGTTIVSNAGLTNRLSSYVNCVATFAQLTTYSESEDVIFCFNLWMAGQPGSVTIASHEHLSDLQRAEVEKARTMLSADPVLSLPSGFAPLKHGG